MVKAVSIIAYFGMIGGLGFLVWTHALFSASGLVISLQAAALLLFLWARVTFGRRSYHVTADPTAGGIVTTGPYRYIRHPIYAAFCLFIVAGAAAHGSWRAAMAAALIIGSALVRVFCEEALVARRYPQYREYAAKTWRMIPYIF
jgi:protein-S-isoprenylcysteine O-methyltransferase Ste14